MRIIFLLVILLSATNIPTWGQHYNLKKMVYPHLKIAKPNPIYGFMNDSIQSHFRKYYAKNLKIPVLKNANNAVVQMPCLRPEIDSNMPIIKPDSLIHFTLLLKRFD